ATDLGLAAGGTCSLRRGSRRQRRLYAWLPLGGRQVPAEFWTAKFDRGKLFPRSLIRGARMHRKKVLRTVVGAALGAGLFCGGLAGFAGFAIAQTTPLPNAPREDWLALFNGTD